MDKKGTSDTANTSTKGTPNINERIQKLDELQKTDDEIERRFDLDPLDESDIEYELALNETGFGKFNYHILLFCGIIYARSAIGLTVLSFILPAAVNEFNLTSTNKGILLAIPMIGMLFGSYFWGCLASTKGRWITLLASLLMDGIFGLISIFMPNFESFAIARFFNGFAVSGTMNICFPFLGEFQPVHHREKMLCWLEFFWVLGIVILPGIAYGIIPLEFYYNNNGFTFTSWKLYLIICSAPNFLLAIWLIYFPESPKFLVEHDERNLALEILIRVFRINTGLPGSEYAVAGVKRVSFVSVHKIHSRLYVTVKKLRPYKSQELKLLIKAATRYTARLFSRKYLQRTILLFGIQFGLTCSYYTLMLWFPELFNRYKIYHIIMSYNNVSICEVSKELSKRPDEVAEIQEQTPVDDGVYSETLYLGLACLPLSIIFPFIVHRVGSRLLLGIGLVFDSLAVFLILIAETELLNLILSCIFKLLASISISLLYAITVDLYPAKIRVIAAALGMSIGRCAALLGNLSFGYLIDSYCFLPFAAFGTLLLISSVLTFLLPAPDPKIHFGENKPRVHNMKRSLLNHL